MKKAHYYESVIPPKAWLIHASLLWDKIWVGNGVEHIVQGYAREMLLDTDGRFVYELSTRTKILDDSVPSLDRNRLFEEEETRFDEHFEYASALFDEILDPSNAPPDGKLFPRPSYEQFCQILTLANKVLVPSWAQNAFDDLDCFFNNTRDFQQCHSLNTTALFASIEAIVPKMPEAIELKQLLDFRESTQLQRLKFRQEVQTLLDTLFACSTEADLHTNMKLCREFIEEQVNILQLNYRAHKIEAIKKSMGITFTAPALVGALASVLDIPFYMPAAIVSAISLSIAEVLLAIEKGKSQVSSSPWGYVNSLKKL